MVSIGEKAKKVGGKGCGKCMGIDCESENMWDREPFPESIDDIEEYDK